MPGRFGMSQEEDNSTAGDGNLFGRPSELVSDGRRVIAGTTFAMPL